MAINPSGGAGIPRSLLIKLYLPAFFVYLGRALTTSFIVLHASGLGASPAAAGVVAALPHLGTMLFDLPAGNLADRRDLHRLHRWAILLLGIASIFIWLIPGIYPFCALLVCYGALRSLWTISQIAVVREAVDEEYRGRALSLMGGIVRIASIIGPIAGGFLAARYGIPLLFLVAGLLMIGASLARFLLRPPPGVLGPGKGSPRSYRSSFRRFLPLLLRAGTGIVILGLLRSARPVILPLYGASLGLDVGKIGLVMGLSGAADALLFYPAGIIYDSFGIKRGAILCLLIFSLGLCLIPMTTGFYGFVAAALVIGVGNGFGAGINMTFSAVLAPDDEVGSFIGAWRLFTDAGVLAGPLAVGALSAVAGIAVAPAALGIIGFGGALFFRLAAPDSKPIP